MNRWPLGLVAGINFEEMSVYASLSYLNELQNKHVVHKCIIHKYTLALIHLQIHSQVVCQVISLKVTFLSTGEFLQPSPQN